MGTLLAEVDWKIVAGWARVWNPLSWRMEDIS